MLEYATDLLNSVPEIVVSFISGNMEGDCSIQFPDWFDKDLGKNFKCRNIFDFFDKLEILAGGESCYKKLVNDYYGINAITDLRIETGVETRAISSTKRKIYKEGYEDFYSLEEYLANLHKRITQPDMDYTTAVEELNK